MKIHSITIDQFKKFTLPTRLEGFGDGLNVISGPNEMGKSTILEAIKAVLFERHKSKNAVIKSFQHVCNDTAPIISLIFELDEVQYKIEKRFIKSPYAKLTMPGRVVDGDEAEDMLQQLLGFNQAGKSGASPDTLGLWSVLWVRQGESLYAELSDLACNTVQSCLEAEVGILTGGQRGQTLLPAIETALNEIVDKRDKPKSRYREVIDQLAIVEAQLVEFKSKYAVVEEDLTHLERYRRELQSFQDSEAESKVIGEIESAKRRHKEVSAIQSEISIIEKEIKLYRNELETKQQIIEERENLLKEYEEAKKEAEQALEAIEVKASNEKEYAKAVFNLKEKMAGIEKSKSTVEKELKHLRKINEAIYFQEKLQELEANCKLATEAYQEYAELKRQANQIRIDAKKVKMIQQAFRDKEQALMALQACATSLIFKLKPESQNIIQINGLALNDPGQELQIVDETHLELKDIGTIRITPGITDKRTLTETLTKAENVFNELLEESGIKTLEEAENFLQNKMSLSSQAESKLKESQIYAPGDAKIGLLPGAAELEQYIKTLKEDQTTRLSELGLECLPSRENVSNSLQKTEESAEKSTSEYNHLKVNLAGQEVVWDEAKKALVQQQSILEHAEKNADRLKLQLESVESKAPKASIQEQIEEIMQKIKEENTKLEQHKLKQGQDTIELIEARINRLEEQLNNRRAKINQLNVDISGLQNRVQILEAEGLEESITLTEKREEKLLQERGKFEREVKVLKLLQNTLSEAEAEARERYLAPVVNKIKPHLQVLFPRSTVEIDEGFKITGIVRDGDTLESFDHLSLGTKEQIAILVRLAFAEMLIEQGKPATLILDDALVFSDDERISLMFDILNLAARKMQVIVFTCRQKVFASLGGTQITIKPEPQNFVRDSNTHVLSQI